MLKHTSTARYPASASVLMRMFTDRAFHTRKLEALGTTRFEVLDHAFDGRNFRIKIDRRVPVAAPGGAKKLMGGETRVINEELWDVTTMTGRVLVEPVGMPVEMSCDTTIAEDGGDSVVTFHWTINAKIPVVGGTLEKFIVGDMEKRADEEIRVAVGFLKDYA
ncbi:MAG: DUF2505 domain-containing protein [Gammaproteobacteria bacterium]|nr:DUF2505 domain-containing protein [Gammaproteobacteria bacterium]